MGGSNDLALKVILAVDDAQSSKVKGFGSTLGSLVDPAGMVAKGFGAISTAAIGFAAAAVDSAASFQQSMLRNQALAGLTQDQYTSMSNAILDLSPKVGKAPKELADSLYYVLSAGVPASKAIDAVRESAMLAATGMTNTSTTANALTSVMKVFGLSSKDAADLITKSVADGKMTMEQYANSIGKLSLTSKGYNVSAYETGAALDTLSNNGFPKAAQASQGLANFLSIIDGRTDTVAKRFDSLQPSIVHTSNVLENHNGHLVMVTKKTKDVVDAFDEQKFKTMDLAHQIAYLSEKFKGHEDHLQFLLGGSRNAAQAFQALSGDTKGYSKILDDLKHSSDGAGAAQDAFTITQKGLNQQIEQAKAAFDALMIKIGTALLPILTKLVSFIAPAIDNFMKFTDAMSKNEVAMDALKAVLIAGAGVILGVLIPALITWGINQAIVAAGVLATAAPFILIGAIVAAVIFGIILAVQHWGQIVEWLKGAWGNVVHFFQDLWHNITQIFGAIGQWFQDRWQDVVNIFGKVGGWFHDRFTDAWNGIVSIFGNIGKWFEDRWTDIVDKFKKIFGGLKDFAQGVWNGIADGVKGAFNFVIGFINTAIDKVNGVTGLVHIPAIPHIPLLAEGGDITSGGRVIVGDRGPELLDLPTGARVTPLQGGSSGGGGGNTFIFNVYGGPNASANDVANLVMAKLNSKYRRSGVVGNSAFGARSS